MVFPIEGERKEKEGGIARATNSIRGNEWLIAAPWKEGSTITLACAAPSLAAFLPAATSERLDSTRQPLARIRIQLAGSDQRLTTPIAV